MLFDRFVVIIKDETTIPGGNSGAISSNLPTAFNSLYIYDLVFAKLYKFGLGVLSLKLLHSYLAETRQHENR